MADTITWLQESLHKINDAPILHRVGRSWEGVAGFSRQGCIFCIYKDTATYCVHSGEDWKEDEEPNLGYYNIALSWDELISAIAKRYDEIRAGIHHTF